MSANTIIHSVDTSKGECIVTMYDGDELVLDRVNVGVGNTSNSAQLVELLKHYLVVSGVHEHRIQPNTQLTATATSPGRSYFVTLFKISRESLADQLVTDNNKTRMRTFAPDWFDSSLPTNPKTTWENEFTSGDYTYTKDIMNNQIANSEWD